MINATFFLVKTSPMRIIQSSSNPRIQAVKKLQRSRGKPSFVVEGKKLTHEAFASGVVIKEIFVTPEFWARERHWLEPIEKQGTTFLMITPALLKSISSVETPPGILAVAQRPENPKPVRLQHFGVMLLSIRDPGNLGAILRIAEACGTDWVAYSSDCADPYQSKVARGSMGSLFRVPLLEVEKPFEFLNEKLQQHITVYGLSTLSEKSLFELAPVFPFILCIGSESGGLPEGLPVTQKISIPMKGNVESLNAAVATAVFLYTVGRATGNNS
jgi:TrmH family RNA methyltransferase